MPHILLGVLWRNCRFESKRIQLFIGVLESCCAVAGVKLPELLNRSAPFPVAVLLFAVVLFWSAAKPFAVFAIPVLLLWSAAKPLAVLALPVLLWSASKPRAVLPSAVVLLWSAA